MKWNQLPRPSPGKKHKYIILYIFPKMSNSTSNYFGQITKSSKLFFYRMTVKIIMVCFIWSGKSNFLFGNFNRNAPLSQISDLETTKKFHPTTTSKSKMAAPTAHLNAFLPACSTIKDLTVSLSVCASLCRRIICQTDSFFSVSQR